MQNIWIPNILFILCQSSNTLTYSNNCIAFPSALGLKKCHRRECTSEGLTNNIQLVGDHRSKRLQCQRNSESNYFTFDWAEFMRVNITSRSSILLMIAKRKCLKFVNATRYLDRTMAASQMY
jgi:hypothetical protein